MCEKNTHIVYLTVVVSIKGTKISVFFFVLFALLNSGLCGNYNVCFNIRLSEFSLAEYFLPCGVGNSRNYQSFFFISV